MWNKIIAVVTVIIALVIAIWGTSAEAVNIQGLMWFSNFFEVMLPILGVGALLKYLTYCPKAGMWNTILPAVTFIIALIMGL
jgi:hypothetical protein